MECSEQPQTTSPAVATAEAPAAEAEPTKPKTRLLKDVEAEENAYIYKTLYKSLDDAKDESIKQEFSESSDILKEARLAKAEFYRATSLPLAHKAKGCGALVNRLGEQKNKQVASVFFMATAMMFTLPVAAVFVGMQVVAPRMAWDPSLCGGFAGVAVAVAIMLGYTVYAFVEDADRVREENTRKAADAAGQKEEESAKDVAPSKKKD